MIKNVIFDIGMVLVNFKWEEIMSEVGATPEEIKTFGKEFIHGAWKHLDKGDMPEEEVLEILKRDNPTMADKVTAFWDRIEDTIESYDYSRKWIQELKDRGYKVYLLTNYPDSFFTKSVEDKFDFYDLVDGEVVSARVKHIKPEPEIYQILFDKYSLVPSECAFMDDRADNVAAAIEQGMKAFTFEGYEDAKQKLEALLAAE